MIPRVQSLVALILLLCIPLYSQVTTAQYNNARTGANTKETLLTPKNVNPGQFGKLFSLPVDGAVFAQPLYLPHLEIPGHGKYKVLFVATEHDSVYAFDADRPVSAPLWHVSFLRPGEGVTPLSSEDTKCDLLGPEVGITSTPVIDATTGILYVVARTKERDSASVRFVQKLHALDVATGREKLGGPVTIGAFVYGKAGHGPNGRLNFDPRRGNQRSALLLTHGKLYVAWASSCDDTDYHGWMIVYDAHSLKQLGVFTPSPDTEKSGIWDGQAGPAADDDGNVYFATGNGIFDATSGGRDYGDTLLKMNLTRDEFSVLDYFTPFNQQKLYEIDRDLGAGGPVLLPKQPGAHPYMVVVAGKGGTIYLVDRDRMGEYHEGNDSHAVQAIQVNVAGNYGAPSYWNQNLYFVFNGDVLKAFSLADDHLSLRPTAQSSVHFAYPGARTTVSSNGARNGIVWVVRPHGWETGDPPAVLYAFEARNVTHELYSSEQNSKRDRAGPALRFIVPTIVDGHVYVGTGSSVDVYGLIPAP